ncbi:putative C-type lectin domain family 20 member A [Mugil cephalus]|uniref:putative C-type lectin domain family 20 member A n=1 Tax=Mugil cephalus TaxID=48193 RepID=UPI001FB7D6C6|nr:putative C-type lectin domain family 20 member A [Mugil cephalus]
MEQKLCENEAKVCATADSPDNIRDCAERHKFICYCAKTTKNKFRLINKEKKWRDAQSHCRKKYTDLVSGPEHIQDPEFKKLIETVNEPVWISQFRPWRWSDGSDYSYRNWKRDPNQGGKYCSFMSRESGKWKTGDCMEKKPFFCYYDKLVLIREEKTWEAALEYCRANHKDLVSITERDEQRLVQQTAQTVETPYVWLGLRYSCPLVMWFWVSDRLVRYENWASAEHTDEQCDVAVAMNKDGQWVKRKDSEKSYFVCSSW